MKCDKTACLGNTGHKTNPTNAGEGGFTRDERVLPRSLSLRRDTLITTPVIEVNDF